MPDLTKQFKFQSSRAEVPTRRLKLYVEKTRQSSRICFVPLHKISSIEEGYQETCYLHLDLENAKSIKIKMSAAALDQKIYCSEPDEDFIIDLTEETKPAPPKAARPYRRNRYYG